MDFGRSFRSQWSPATQLILSSALFLLFIQYAAPSGKVHGDHFAAVKAAEETETLFDWPRISWISVFQYPIIELASVVILEATEATGRYCTNSLEPQFAHLWVELIETVSIGACVIAIVSFRGHMKQLFKVKRGIPKLVCFKATVFLRFAQAWAFSTLLSYGVIKTSSSLSYNDIIWGMPGLCTCAEMVLFSLGFWYAFSSTEYSSTAKPYEQPLPLGKAILDALNPSDLVLGIARIFPIWGEVHRKGDWKKWLVAQRETGIIGFVRRSVTKFKDRKDASNGQRPYKELNESMEALTKPIESYHGRSESELTQKGAESYPMTAMGGPELYQPPSTTPPDEVDGHLKADAYPGGPRSPSPGRWNGQTYDRSHSPTATYGREMV